jgi:hypothetical protein
MTQPDDTDIPYETQLTNARRGLHGQREVQYAFDVLAQGIANLKTEVAKLAAAVRMGGEPKDPVP